MIRIVQLYHVPRLGANVPEIMTTPESVEDAPPPIHPPLPPNHRPADPQQRFHDFCLVRPSEEFGHLALVHRGV